jgi:hypothetical protein
MAAGADPGSSGDAAHRGDRAWAVLDRLAFHGLGSENPSLENWLRLREIIQRVEVGSPETRITLKTDAWEARRAVHEDHDHDDMGKESTPDRILVGEDKVVIITRSTGLGFDGGVRASIPSDSTFTGRRDPRMIRYLVQAEHWKRRLRAGELKSVAELAKEEGMRADYVMKLLRLHF